MQGTVILYGPQYRPANGNGPPIDLPTLEPVGRQKTFYLQYWHRVCFVCCHAFLPGVSLAALLYLLGSRPRLLCC